MNKALCIPFALAAAACGFTTAAQAQQGQQAQDVGRVLSSTPVVQQVPVPRQVCNNQPVAVQQPKSGAGAAIGAIAGGAMGNAVGAGSGRAAATMLGLVGGAIIGDRVEGGGVSVQNATTCTTQTFYENRTVAYNVVYEFAGRQYSVQMPNDPGPTIQLQVSPVGAAPDMSQPYANGGYAQPAYAQPAVVAPAYVVPGTYVAPVYYPRPYYAPIGLSIGLGYYGGYRRHWR